MKSFGNDEQRIRETGSTHAVRSSPGSLCRIKRPWPVQNVLAVLIKLLSRIITVVYDTVFPTHCLACGDFNHPSADDSKETRREPDNRETGATRSIREQVDRHLSAYVCPVCIRGIAVVESPLCSYCGVPFQSREGEDRVCGGCLTSPKRFRIARAPLVYDQTVVTVIQRFKFRGKIQLARPLSEILLTTFKCFWDVDSIDVIIPVPLHVKRLRERGFNQSYLLIQNWNDSASHDRSQPFNLQNDGDILFKKAFTEAQTGLGRKQRLLNVKNAFGIRNDRKIKNKGILLVDDVYTTGATVDECARLLLDHGASHVDVLTLARAM